MLIVFIQVAAGLLFKVILFGGLYILRRRFDKSVADMRGWTFVKPSIMLWILSIMCAACALLMIFVLSSDGECACRTPEKIRNDYYAVIGMLVFALGGLSFLVWHMIKIYRQRLGFNGNLMTYAGVNGEQKIGLFTDVTDVHFRWAYLEGVTLSNGRRLYLDEYTLGCDEFMTALITHNSRLRDWFEDDGLDLDDLDNIGPVATINPRERW